MTYTIPIRLPQGVTFSLPLAGPVSRCLAFLVDLLVISAVSAVLEQTAESVQSFVQDIGTGLLILLYFATWTLYGILCEYYWHGQTVGKRLLGLRVVDARGLELQLYQLVIRNLIRSVDLFPLLGLTAGVTMLCNEKLQRLGDIAAGTVVVRKNEKPAPKLDSLMKGRYNSFLKHQLLCARLRQRIPQEAAALAIDALIRRDRLDDRARIEVFDELVAYLRQIVEFPPQDTEPLSSEQYVRNVVEILSSPVRTPVNQELDANTRISLKFR